MSNPLINKIIPQMPVQGNQMGNMSQMISNFQQFRKIMTGRNPQQIINNLIASGQMTTEQYGQLLTQAKSMISMFR